MKRRNGRWHKEKQIRRLQEKRDELRIQSRTIEYIPLEKPVFAGWDVSIGLTESGLHRQDALEIQRILNVLNVDKGIFSRNVKFIKSIRNSGHTIQGLRVTLGTYGHYPHYGLASNHISFHIFHNLPEDLKRYFSKDKYYKYSLYGREYYALNYSFPWYACKVLINKSYYNYRGIPNSEAEREYDKLSAWLNKYDLKTWGRNSYRDDFRKSNKVAMQNALKKIIKKQYSPDEIIDYHDEIFRNTCQRKDFGWS